MYDRSHNCKSLVVNLFYFFSYDNYMNYNIYYFVFVTLKLWQVGCTNKKLFCNRN